MVRILMDSGDALELHGIKRTMNVFSESFMLADSDRTCVLLVIHSLRLEVMVGNAYMVSHSSLVVRNCKRDTGRNGQITFYLKSTIF